MLVDRRFPASFEFEVLTELPNSGVERFYFPGGGKVGGRDGPSIRFMPATAVAWVGTFAFGGFGPTSFTGVFTTPNPNQLCVVTEGSALLVDADHGGPCTALAIVPVRDVRVSLRHKLLIFADHTELMALGADGIAWRTARIGWDDLKLTVMSDDCLYGTCWDLPSESEVSFNVDLVTGAHSGGSSFPT